MVTAILPSSTKQQSNLAETLREHGYGVTQSYGQGREGDRMIWEILSPRKNERDLYKLIKELEPRVFIISYEPKFISGGFWTKKVRNRNKKNSDWDKNV